MKIDNYLLILDDQNFDLLLVFSKDGVNAGLNIIKKKIKIKGGYIKLNISEFFNKLCLAIINGRIVHILTYRKQMERPQDYPRFDNPVFFELDLIMDYLNKKINE